MPLLIAVLLVTWMLKKAVGDTIVDNNLAKQGKISPRLEQRHGVSAAAKVAKYGFLDHLRDNWSDYWSRRTDALIAARDAGPSTPGEKVRWRDRWAAAKGVMTRVATKVKDHPVTRILIDPVGEPRPAKVVPAMDPVPTPADPDAPVEAETVKDTAVLPNPSKEPSVSQPTGEATNLHQAIAEIDAITAQVQMQQDQAAAAKSALDAVDNAIDGMQARQSVISNAARSLAEHLTALNVNASILAPLFDTANMLAASDADQLISAVEAARAIVDKILAGCDAALAALATARQTLVAKFADAAAVVESDLGGDSRFVGGENPASAPAARQAA